MTPIDALLEHPGLRNSLVVNRSLITILGTKLTCVQNSGFSVTSSWGTLTLLGMLAVPVSALPILLESQNGLRSRWSSGGLDINTNVR
jgi:hypothetical protein